jgi:hypothetical protein
MLIKDDRFSMREIKQNSNDAVRRDVEDAQLLDEKVSSIKVCPSCRPKQWSDLFSVRSQTRLFGEGHRRLMRARKNRPDWLRIERSALCNVCQTKQTAESPAAAIKTIRRAILPSY